MEQIPKRYKSLEQIFDDDDFHLIEIKKKASSGRTADQRLVDSFEEINEFYEREGREPDSNPQSIAEFTLYSRLNGLKENDEKILQLAEFDRFGLLPRIEVSHVNDPETPYVTHKKKFKSLDDVINDDGLGDGDQDELDLFRYKHIPKGSERASADFVAHRKSCKNFSKYEPLFKKVHADLKEGKRKIIQFKQENLRSGDFYVHNGMLLYLEHVEFEEEEQEFKSGKRVRKDGRTKTIFENATESQMLYRSLYKILLENGHSVTENFDEVNKEFEENFSDITSDDEEAGTIYVLTSKSDDPRIQAIDNLYKIGFSKGPVEERIKNAERQPTYLMAPVTYVTGWRCYNMNPQKFEVLIHNFFGSSCLEVDVFDGNGRRHTPREWFVVPLEVIETAVSLIISGAVLEYKYDPIEKVIVKI